MAQFNNMVLTNKGAALLSKIQASGTLQFTGAAIGDGSLAQGQTLQGLTTLIHKTKDLSITNIENLGNGTARIRAQAVSNEALEQGMYIREIGLFATDPDEGTILYAIANAGALADYLPPFSVNPVEELINLVISIGQATNVTAVIDQSMVYMTRSEFDQAIKLPSLKLGVSSEIPISNVDSVWVPWNHISWLTYDTSGMRNGLDPTKMICQVPGKYRLNVCIGCYAGDNETGELYAEVLYLPAGSEIGMSLAMEHKKNNTNFITLQMNTSMILQEGDVIKVSVANSSAGNGVRIGMTPVFPNFLTLECFELI